MFRNQRFITGLVAVEDLVTGTKQSSGGLLTPGDRFMFIYLCNKKLNYYSYHYFREAPSFYFNGVMFKEEVAVTAVYL